MDQPQIIVSLWDGEPDTETKQNYLGCGVCVASNKILTAKHVVCPEGMPEISAKQIHAGLSGTRENGIPGEDVIHCRERDISLLVLKQPHGKTEVECNTSVQLATSQQVELLAYNNQERCLKGPFPVPLTNWVKPDGWEFHTEPAPGMSGGAALLDSKLIGIIQARDENQNSGIIVPLSAIHAFLEEHLQTQLPKPQSPLNHDELDQEFEQDIREAIAKTLQKNPCLLSKLNAQYGLTETTTAEVLADKLTDQCAQGQLWEVLQNLRDSLDDCMDEPKQDHQDKSNLLKSAKQLLPYLTLFTVRKDWLKDYRAAYASSSEKAHQIPDMPSESLHVAFSKQDRAVPSFDRSNADGMSAMGDMFKLEHGVGKDDTGVLRILSSLHKLVYDGRRELPENKDKIAKEINARLKLRKSGSALKRKSHFMPVSDAVLSKDKQSELEKLLPEMGWVKLEVGSQQKVFVIDDNDLMTVIEDFNQI